MNTHHSLLPLVLAACALLGITFAHASTTAPTDRNLSATAITDATATLRCNLSADEYTWRWRKQGTSTWTTSNSSALASLKLTGLEAGSDYEYECKVACRLLPSPWSTTQTFTTLPACPSPTLAEITANEITATSVKFICTAPYDELIWRWRRQGDPDWITTGAFFPFPSAQVSLDHEASTYEFGCRLKCGASESDWSPTKTFETPWACPPATIDQISATEITATSVRFTCTAPYDELIWRWRRQGDPEWITTGEFFPFPSAQVELEHPGSTYEFGCQLLCGTDESPWSPTGTFVTPSACPAPTAEQITATNISHAQVTFICSAPADEYQWSWRVQGTFEWANFSPFWSNNQMSSGLSSPDTTYEYRCRLRCGEFESDWSPVKSFQTLTDPCPTPGFAELTATVVSFTEVRLSCSAVADEYGWRYRKFGETLWTGIGFTTDSSSQIGPLDPGQEYEFSCRLKCGTSMSEWSSWSVTGAFEMPPSPRVTDVTSNSNGESITISWDSHYQATYRILRLDLDTGRAPTWEEIEPTWPASPVGTTSFYTYEIPPGSPVGLFKIHLVFPSS